MKTGKKLTTLAELLARLQDRATKLQPVDATLARDVELLRLVIEEHESLITDGALQICELLLERTRVLASALLVVDQVGSSRMGPLLTAATREALERWLVEPTHQPAEQNADARHGN